MLLKLLVGTIVLFYILFIYTSFLLSVSKPDEFYNATWVQMMTPAIQILTLFTIAYYINIVVSKKNKKYEILADLTNLILDTLEELRKELEEYFSTKDSPNNVKIAKVPGSTISIDNKAIESIEKSERDILHLFRVLSNKELFQYQMYEELNMEDFCKDRENDKKIKALKKSVTSTVFKQNGNKFSITEKQHIRKQLDELVGIYTKEKIYLYTVK